MIRSAGRIEYAVLDADTGETAQSGAQPNLITDAGFAYLAGGAFASFATYLAVGTGSAPPARTDTALTAQAGVRSSADGGVSNTRTRPAPGVYEFTVSREIPAGPGTALNATEWGFSVSPDGALHVRQLFRDGQGVPVVVTKTDAQKLRVIYTLRVELGCPAWTPGTITIDGLGSVSGQLFVLGGSPGTPRDLEWTQNYLSGTPMRFGYLNSDPGRVAYDGSIWRGHVTNLPRLIGAARSDGREPWSCTLDTSGAPVTVYGLGMWSSNDDGNNTDTAYVFVFDTPYIKPADKALTMRGPRLTLGAL